MRRHRVLLSLFLAVLLTQGGQSTAAPTGPDCAPAGSRPVTMLARSGVGHAFAKLEHEAGLNPFLHPELERTFVPVRALVEMLSPGPDTVLWHEVTRTATFTRGKRMLAITIPADQSRTSTAFVNGRAVQVDAFLCQGRIYAPVRAVAAALSAGVKWYPDRTVVVDPASVTDPASVDAPIRPARAPGASALERGGSESEPGVWIGPDCGAWPAGFVSFLLSPAESARLAARAAACAFVGGS